MFNNVLPLTVSLILGHGDIEMKKQLLILTLTFLTTNILAAPAPAISTSWKDVTNISHKQCMNKAEKASRNSGYIGKFSILNKNTIFKIAGEYHIAIRCGTIGKSSKFAFFIVSGSKLNKATQIRKNIVKNF